MLITSLKLSRWSGSELYVWDLATDLRARTVSVIGDLAMMSAPPDIIHGQGNHEFVTALLHFPDVPAIRVCHSPEEVLREFCEQWSFGFPVE